MAAAERVKCSNCWAAITLDAAACPHCGFVFGEGKIGAALQRTLKGEPAIEPTIPPVASRSKSGLLAAGGFAVCIGILAFAAMSVPLIGLLIYGALYWASPFSWGWALVAGVDAPWPVQQAYLPLAFAAPFPIVGLLVGFLWPFRIQSWAQVFNAIGMRFAISLGVLGVSGVGLFVVALRT